MTDRVPIGLRAAVALVGLALVLWIVGDAVGDYRSGKTGESRPQGAESTATPEPDEDDGEEAQVEEEAPAKGSETDSGDAGEEAADDGGPKVVVKVDGLNFRKAPSTGSEVIRGLSEGEELRLIETDGGWHHAEDADGVKGYLAASTQYSSVSE